MRWSATVPGASDREAVDRQTGVNGVTDHGSTIMAIASKVQDFLTRRGLHYDVLTHPHSRCSMETAHLANVPIHALAKSVVLEDDSGYLMAVLPDSAPDRKLDLAAVWGDLRELRRQRVEVIPIRRRDFDEDRGTPGELAEAVAREGYVVYGR